MTPQFYLPKPLPAGYKCSPGTKASDIQMIINSSVGNVDVRMSDNAANREVIIPLLAASVLAGAAAASKRAVWQDIFGLAVLGFSAYGVYKAGVSFKHGNVMPVSGRIHKATN